MHTQLSLHTYINAYHLQFMVSMRHNRVSEGGAQWSSILKQALGSQYKSMATSKITCQKIQVFTVYEIPEHSFSWIHMHRTAFICLCSVFSCSLFFLVVFWWPSFQICIPAFVQLALKSLPQPYVYTLFFTSFTSIYYSSYYLCVTTS